MAWVLGFGFVTSAHLVGTVAQQAHVIIHPKFKAEPGLI